MQHFYDTRFLYLISGYRGMLQQPFYTLLRKELKDLCFSVDKNIAQSIQCTASSKQSKQLFHVSIMKELNI